MPEAETPEDVYLRAARALVAAYPDLTSFAETYAKDSDYRRMVDAAREDLHVKLQRALDLLARILDEDPCRLDERGFCREHGYALPCVDAEAVKLLREVASEQPAEWVTAPGMAEAIASVGIETPGGVNVRRVVEQYHANRHREDM